MKSIYAEESVPGEDLEKNYFAWFGEFLIDLEL